MKQEDQTVLAQVRREFNVTHEPPMERFFKGESIFNREYDPMLLNTIGHELNHLIAAYKLNVPLESMTLTAVPEGNTLGKVTLPDHVDMKTLQVVAMAGSVPAPDGKAQGFGSDVYKAKLIEILANGKPIQQARSEAASLISFYDSDVREMCAKIIAYLQTEKNMPYIEGDLFRDIEKRARYELEMKNKPPEVPVFFKPIPPEEMVNKNTIEDTVGRAPDKRTIITYLPDNKCTIHTVTDDQLEETVSACSLCFYPTPDHTEDCPARGHNGQTEAGGHRRFIPKLKQPIYRYQSRRNIPNK